MSSFEWLDDGNRLLFKFEGHELVYFRPAALGSEALAGYDQDCYYVSSRQLWEACHGTIIFIMDSPFEKRVKNLEQGCSKLLKGHEELQRLKLWGAVGLSANKAYVLKVSAFFQLVQDDRTFPKDVSSMERLESLPDPNPHSLTALSRWLDPVERPGALQPPVLSKRDEKKTYGLLNIGANPVLEAQLQSLRHYYTSPPHEVPERESIGLMQTDMLKLEARVRDLLGVLLVREPRLAACSPPRLEMLMSLPHVQSALEYILARGASPRHLQTLVGEIIRVERWVASTVPAAMPTAHSAGGPAQDDPEAADGDGIGSGSNGGGGGGTTAATAAALNQKLKALRAGLQRLRRSIPALISVEGGGSGEHPDSPVSGPSVIMPSQHQQQQQQEEEEIDVWQAQGTAQQLIELITARGRAAMQWVDTLMLDVGGLTPGALGLAFDFQATVLAAIEVGFVPAPPMAALAVLQWAHLDPFCPHCAAPGCKGNTVEVGFDPFDAPESFVLRIRHDHKQSMPVDAHVGGGGGGAGIGSGGGVGYPVSHDSLLHILLVAHLVVVHPYLHPSDPYLFVNERGMPLDEAHAEQTYTRLTGGVGSGLTRRAFTTIMRQVDQLDDITPPS